MPRSALEYNQDDNARNTFQNTNGEIIWNDDTSWRAWSRGYELGLRLRVSGCPGFFYRAPIRMSIESNSAGEYYGKEGKSLIFRIEESFETSSESLPESQHRDSRSKDGINDVHSSQRNRMDSELSPKARKRVLALHRWLLGARGPLQTAGKIIGNDGCDATVILDVGGY